MEQEGRWGGEITVGVWCGEGGRWSPGFIGIAATHRILNPIYRRSTQLNFTAPDMLRQL
jgi:hypothetical protein